MSATETASTRAQPTGDGPPAEPATPAAAGPPRAAVRPGAAPKPRPTGAPRTGVRTSRVVLRRLDPWSVLKLSLLFYLSLCVVLLTAGVLLWAGASSIGVVGNIESFMDSIGFTDFEFEAGQILRASALAGLVLVVAGTFGNVLMAVLYNLITEVVGGLKLTLAEDDSHRRI